MDDESLPEKSATGDEGEWWTKVKHLPPRVDERFQCVVPSLEEMVEEEMPEDAVDKSFPVWTSSIDTKRQRAANSEYLIFARTLTVQVPFDWQKVNELFLRLCSTKSHMDVQHTGGRETQRRYYLSGKRRASTRPYHSTRWQSSLCAVWCASHSWVWA
jgi:hypothetical protein